MLRKCLEIDPSNKEILYFLGEIEYKIKPKDAINTLIKTIEYYPDDLKIQSNLSLMTIEVGFNLECLELRSKEIRCSPNELYIKLAEDSF